MVDTPGVQELGTAGGVRKVRKRRGKGEEYESEPLEPNLELAFPESIPVYDRIRKEDGHVGSVLNAIILTTAKANWQLTGTGTVRPEVMELVRRNLGIPEPGKAIDSRSKVVWRTHVVEAAEPMLWAGFMCFEQVYQVNPVTGEVSLRKLAPRLPRTIRRFIVERDGGLKAVEQEAPHELKLEPIRIPVNRLVVYVNRKEGADWSGRSVLRTAYKHFLLKDAFIRLDAQAAERGSMGIPTIHYQEEHHRAHAEDIVAEVRAGERAGVALPQGMQFSIEGTTGSTVDLVPRMRYHDQEIARSSLAMFLDVTSNENGSRALMEPVLGVFLDSVQAFAEQIGEVATEHIIRDLVRYNYGPDEPYPTLSPGDVKAAQGISVEALKTLVETEVVIPDDDLEHQQREQYGLPTVDPAKRRLNRFAARNIHTLLDAGYTPEGAAAATGVPAHEHTGHAPATHDAPEPTEPAEQHELPGFSELLTQLTETQRQRQQWYEARDRNGVG